MIKEVYAVDNQRENIDLDKKMNIRFRSELVTTNCFDRAKDCRAGIYHISDATVILDGHASKYFINFYGRQDAIKKAVSKIEDSLELKLGMVERWS